ncbi:MAG: hypothetical protein MJZ68_00755 [archaeon]|nr:hypothetical protein [archaeon]
MALVVVLLAFSVAISGFLIIKTIDGITGGDPFEKDRHYAVEGTMSVDGSDIPCTGYSDSRYVSETEAFSVFTFKTYYGNGYSGYIKSQLMFDIDRIPVSSIYTYVGEEDGNQLWCSEKDGMKTVYALDKDKVVVSFHITSDECDLVATLVKE